MLRAIVTAADMAVPVANPETLAELELVSTKVLNELRSSPVLGKMWAPQASFRNEAAGTLNLDFNFHPLEEVVHGGEGERKFAQSLIENEANLQLVGKMKRGTHGAWLTRTEEGENRIFKFVSSDDVRPQLQLSADSSRAVNSTIARTPQYRQIGFTPGKGSWYTQEFLPGQPAPAPTESLISRMMVLNEMAAGKALAGGKNWSEEVMNALYKDSKGWQKSIAASGPEGKTFVADVQSMIHRNRLLSPQAGDIVHGDFQHYNALVDRNGKLSGYIDWEGAGRGDRGIDLSRLLYDAYVSEAEIGFKTRPDTLQMMSDRLAAMSGTAHRDNYMNYWALQVADFGLKRSPKDGSMFMGVGRRILDDLKASQKSTSLAA